MIPADRSVYVRGHPTRQGIEVEEHRNLPGPRVHTQIGVLMGRSRAATDALAYGHRRIGRRRSKTETVFHQGQSAGTRLGESETGAVECQQSTNQALARGSGWRPTTASAAFVPATYTTPAGIARQNAINEKRHWTSKAAFSPRRSGAFLRAFLLEPQAIAKAPHRPDHQAIDGGFTQFATNVADMDINRAILGGKNLAVEQACAAHRATVLAH